MELEYDGIPSVESGPIAWIKVLFSDKEFLSEFQLGVFGLILLFEYLRGHIGEKRFSERMIELLAPFSTVVFNDGSFRAVVCVH